MHYQGLMQQDNGGSQFARYKSSCARFRKYKRLKLGGGHLYDCSSV
jgi:hypothetical protein